MNDSIPLWKQCRILANPVRLNMLSCLDSNPRLYVQQVAEQLGVSEDVASKNLEMLGAAGFVRSEPVSKYLYYSLACSHALLHVLLDKLRSEHDVFHKSTINIMTALTHERRVSTVSVLKREGRMDKEKLFSLTQVSYMAGCRHLNKLERRGWVEVEKRGCRLLRPDSRLALALIDRV